MAMSVVGSAIAIAHRGLDIFHHRFKMKITNLLWSTAYHEAGHAVVAMANGLSVHSISIKPDTTSYGRTFSRNPLSGRMIECDASTSNRWRMEREAKVLFAGTVAEKKLEKFNGRRPQNSHSGDSDYESLVHIVSCFCGSDAMLDAYIKLLHEMTILEVEDPENWQRIQQLANILIERGEIRKTDAPLLFMCG
jgi:hypothetical protein